MHLLKSYYLLVNINSTIVRPYNTALPLTSLSSLVNHSTKIYF